MHISGFLNYEEIGTVYCVYAHHLLHRKYAINKNIVYPDIIFLLYICRVQLDVTRLYKLRTQLQDIRCGSELRQVFASVKRFAYSVTVTLNMNSSFIMNVTCQCKCAVLGRCSHVGGLRHAVLDHVSDAESACTSQLCQWNVGKRKGRQPQSLTDVSYSGDAKRRQIDGVSKFDPRPPSLRTTEPKVIANEFVRELQTISSTCPPSWETMHVIGGNKNQ